MAKIGILAAFFGSETVEGQIAIRKALAGIRDAFPGVPVQACFTSCRIRERLKALGTPRPSPEQGLCGLLEQGCSGIAVHPFHVMDGREHGQLVSQAKGWQEGGRLRTVAVSRPLLGKTEDRQALAGAMLKSVLPQRKTGEMCLWIAHGSAVEGANILLEELDRELGKRDPLAALAVLRGQPGIGRSMARIAVQAPEKVWLLPLMAFAGSHTTRDIAGNDENSWLNQIRSLGVDCRAVQRGAAESEAIFLLWMDRLRAALAQAGG